MKKICATLFALATLLMASAAYAESDCTNATIRGSYGFNFSGIQAQLPMAIVGAAMAAGEGNGFATLTISLNGTVSQGVHVVATYTVNPDCTGVLTDLTSNLHYTLVVLRHGAEFLLINTDPGNTFTGDFKKQ